MLKRIREAAAQPVVMRKVNGWLAVFWAAMVPISIVTGWISSVTFLGAISLWALVSGHWSGWQSARVEVHQAEDADVQEVLDEVRRQADDCSPQHPPTR